MAKSTSCLLLIGFNDQHLVSDTSWGSSGGVGFEFSAIVFYHLSRGLMNLAKLCDTML
jgi:hypothetical protein